MEEENEGPAAHDWRENLKKCWKCFGLNSKCLVVDSLILEEGVKLM